jgi:hypothetical protein
VVKPRTDPESGIAQFQRDQSAAARGHEHREPFACLILDRVPCHPRVADIETARRNRRDCVFVLFTVGEVGVLSH